MEPRPDFHFVVEMLYGRGAGVGEADLGPALIEELGDRAASALWYEDRYGPALPDPGDHHPDCGGPPSACVCPIPPDERCDDCGDWAAGCDCPEWIPEVPVAPERRLTFLRNYRAEAWKGWLYAGFDISYVEPDEPEDEPRLVEALKYEVEHEFDALDDTIIPLQCNDSPYPSHHTLVEPARRYQPTLRGLSEPRSVGLS